MNPRVLLEELERARVAHARAELRARTHLAEQGVLEQMHVDVAYALRKMSESARHASSPTAGGTQDG